MSHWPPKLAALLLLLALLGCRQAEKSGQPVVVASIYPYELLARQLLGPGVKVQTLIPANSSPHTYSPKPQELKELQEADLVIANGYGLETNLEQAFAGFGNRLVRAEDLLGNLVPEAGGGVNPHVWLSPRLMQQLAKKMSGRLQTAFPALRDTIAANAAALVSQLVELDSRIQRERETFAKTPVVTYHDSFHYLMTDYKLDYLGSVQESPGREPTPRELARIAGLVGTHGLKAIYVDPQMERKSATVLAKSFALQVIELDPLGSSLPVRTLPDLILSNWEALKQGW